MSYLKDWRGDLRGSLISITSPRQGSSLGWLIVNHVISRNRNRKGNRSRSRENVFKYSTRVQEKVA